MLIYSSCNLLPGLGRRTVRPRVHPLREGPNKLDIQGVVCTRNKMLHGWVLLHDTAERQELVSRDIRTSTLSLENQVVDKSKRILSGQGTVHEKTLAPLLAVGWTVFRVECEVSHIFPTKHTGRNSLFRGTKEGRIHPLVEVGDLPGCTVGRRLLAKATKDIFFGWETTFIRQALVLGGVANVHVSRIHGGRTGRSGTVPTERAM